MALDLSNAELERYSRQLLLPELGGEGQSRLKGSRVLVVGAGALGLPVAGYLAAAGVGYLGIVDSDSVELSNLQRQLLHFTPDIGRNKAESAAAKLGVLNPEVQVDTYPVRLEDSNAEAILAGSDLVVDCSDTFATRYLVNDTCVRLGIALIEAGVLGFAGLVTAIQPGRSACYRCMFPDRPSGGSAPSCSEAGVLGPLAGVVGSIQALEAIKLLTGVGEPLVDHILQIDGLDLSVARVRTSRRADCAACGAVGSQAKAEATPL